MLTMQDIKDTPSIALVNILSEAYQNNDQFLVNICAYELACRIYVPNRGVNFDDLVASFGYKEIEKVENQSFTKKR